MHDFIVTRVKWRKVYGGGQYPDGFYIESVHDFYDHPLSGFCIYKGKRYWFESKYQGKYITILNPSKLFTIKKLCGRWCFEKMVGTHWRYEHGKQISRSTLPKKSTRWTRFLFRLFYNKWFSTYILFK